MNQGGETDTRNRGTGVSGKFESGGTTVEVPPDVPPDSPGVAVATDDGGVEARVDRRQSHSNTKASQQLRVIEGREAVTRYYRMIDKLGGKDRSYFVARTLEGMTLDEVAAAHEVSVSTAQRRINRATKRVAALVRRDPMLAQFAAKQAQASEDRT